MAKRRLYSEELYKTGDASTSLDVKSRRVEQGWVRYITSGSIEDETTDCTAFIFGRLSGSNLVGMEEVESPSSGKRYSLENTHHFLANEEPMFRVESGGSADVIRGYLEGYEVEVSEA